SASSHGVRTSLRLTRGNENAQARIMGTAYSVPASTLRESTPSFCAAWTERAVPIIRPVHTGALSAIFRAPVLTIYALFLSEGFGGLDGDGAARWDETCRRCDEGDQSDGDGHR